MDPRLRGDDGQRPVVQTFPDFLAASFTEFGEQFTQRVLRIGRVPRLGEVIELDMARLQRFDDIGARDGASALPKA